MLRRFWYCILLMFFLACSDRLYAQQEITPLPLDKLNRDSVNKIISQQEKEKNYKGLGLLYSGIFIYFFHTKYRDSATIYALKSEECFYKAGDSVNYYFMQIQLGELSSLAHDLENARNHYQKALGYYYRTKNYKMLFHAYGGLSNIFSLKKDTVNGSLYESLAIEANKKGHDTLGQVILNDIAIQSLIAKNKIDQSIALLYKNIWLITHTKNLGNSEQTKNFWRGLQLNLLGRCYHLKKDYLTAIKYLKEAAKDDKLTENSSGQNMLRSWLLTNSYINLAEKDSALKYLDGFFYQTKKTIDNLDLEKINEVNIKYETEKKQREIAELEQRNRINILTVNNQRKLNISLSIIFLLMLISSYFIIKNVKQKRRIALELSKKEITEKEHVHKQKELEIRNRISRDLHDDVGATLSSVKVYSEILKDNPNNTLIADLIMENASDMIDRLELIAWAANSKFDSFGSLISKMEKFSKHLLRAKQINYSFSADGIEPSMPIPGEVRQNVLLIYKEGINNIIKHSFAKNCLVNLYIEQRNFILKINDDGIGIPVANESSGSGIANIKRRTAELCGELKIKSISDGGTQLSVFIPYPFQTSFMGEHLAH